MTAPIPVLQLEYSTQHTLGSKEALAVFRQMLFLAILSGLCVGVCFLCFTENVVAYFLHVAIFAATILIGIRAGMGMSRMASLSDDPRSKARFVLDCIALVGVAMIGVSPLVYWAVQSAGTSLAEGAAGALGLAYALMAGTTARHVMLYRALAVICRPINRHGLARALIALGWVKAVYEAIWLSCIAGALFFIAFHRASGFSNDLESLAIPLALGGLFGAMGFGAIWIWMIICHARLVSVAK